MNGIQNSIMTSTNSLDERSLYLRRQVMKGLASTGKGHVGSALSLIEIIRVLYDDILRFNPRQPGWPERDRCILSPGHGCLALYAVLADKSFFSTDEISGFVQMDSRLGGCSESTVPGVEATTGSLGHGFSVGVGMALAARIQKRASRVFVIVGDGELGEGSNWEAAMCASKHNLSNLTVIVDDNKVQCSGPTHQVSNFGSLAAKFESFGFSTQEVDGHNVNALKQMFKSVPFNVSRPSAIICHTVMSKGLTFAENNAEWHWKGNLDQEMLRKMYAALETG